MDEFDVILIVLCILGLLRFLYPKLFKFIEFDYTRSFNEKNEKFLRRESGLSYNFFKFICDYRDGVLIKVYWVSGMIGFLLFPLYPSEDIFLTFCLIWGSPWILGWTYIMVVLFVFLLTIMLDVIRSIIKNL